MINKKLLIIKPPYRSFPLGFAYVLACLERWEIPFDFVDTTLPFQDSRRYLKRNDYLAVASGGLIGQYRFFSEIVENVRKINPDLPIILGGNITKDIRYEFLFDKIGIDFGVIGEAETSLPYLVKAIAHGQKDFNNVPGLLYKDKFTGKIIRNMPQRLDLERESILPAWQYFDLDYYSSKQHMPFFGYRSCMPVLSGRGCVGQCSFCSPTIGSFRMRPIKHVMDEIELLNANYSFDWVVIFNEMAYQTKEEILTFCAAYKKLKIRKPWFCSFRADVDFDKETFMTMKESGCVSASAGIESGSDRILELMRKGITVKQTKRFYRLTKEVGLPCNGTFMVGNEAETEREIKETIDMVIHEEMNAVVQLTSSYPGTLIYKNALKRNLVIDEWEYLQRFKFAPGIWDHTWIDRFYMNITDIPDDRFWDVIVAELRRFYTWLSNRYQAKNMQFKFLFQTLCIEAKGSCPQCQAKTVIYPYPPFIFLEMETYCPKCYYRVYFNIYRSKKFVKHFVLLSRELNKAQRIIIAGTSREAAAFLRIDRFAIDYSKVKGFLDVTPQLFWSDTFINKPRVKLGDLLKVKPDIILVVDDEFGNSELLIRQFYLSEGLENPKILHLFPDAKRWSLMLTRFIQRNNLKLSWGIKLTKFIFETKKIILRVVLTLLRVAQTKPKKIVAKKIMHQLRYLYLRLSNFWERYVYLSSFALCFFIVGCATAPYALPTKPELPMPGVYHRVEKGQTLWRISKIYSVDLDEIVRINRIPDATSIDSGQLIFIPSVQKKQYLSGQSSAEDFSWPLRGRVIASFGQTFNDMVNKGINIQRVKSQDVIASRSGKVIFYDTNFNNFGKTIIIEHSDGFLTVYARNSEVFIKTGDYVQKGTVIAKVGSSNTDKNTYLHFEIRKGHIPQNPYFYLPR